jgi:hypothetical protein
MKQRILAFCLGLSLALGGGALAQVYNFFPPPGMTYSTTSGMTIGSPTGGAQGAGTINATGLFVNGTAASTLTTPVSVANGGTGRSTLTSHGVLVGAGSGNVASVAAMAADTLLQGQGATSDPAAASVPNCGDSTHALAYSTSSHNFACQSITGGGSTQFSLAAKPSDTSRSNTNTLTDDPDLQFTAQAAGTYSVEWTMTITGPATANFKLALNCTGSVTVAFWATQMIDASGNRAGNAAQNACSGGTASQTQTALTNATYVVIQGFAEVVTSTTGTISVQWSQAASSGTAVVAKQGSWMRISKIL